MESTLQGAFVTCRLRNPATASAVQECGPVKNTPPCQAGTTTTRPTKNDASTVRHAGKECDGRNSKPSPYAGHAQRKDAPPQRPSLTTSHAGVSVVKITPITYSPYAGPAMKRRAGSKEMQSTDAQQQIAASLTELPKGRAVQFLQARSHYTTRAPENGPYRS